MRKTIGIGFLPVRIQTLSSVDRAAQHHRLYETCQNFLSGKQNDAPRRTFRSASIVYVQAGFAIFVDWKRRRLYIEQL